MLCSCRLCFRWDEHWGCQSHLPLQHASQQPAGGRGGHRVEVRGTQKAKNTEGRWNEKQEATSSQQPTVEANTVRSNYSKTLEDEAKSRSWAAPTQNVWFLTRTWNKFSCQLQDEITSHSAFWKVGTWVNHGESPASQLLEAETLKQAAAEGSCTDVYGLRTSGRILLYSQI